MQQLIIIIIIIGQVAIMGTVLILLHIIAIIDHVPMGMDVITGVPTLITYITIITNSDQLPIQKVIDSII